MTNLQPETKEYFNNLRKEVEKVYAIAKKAKVTGLDPTDDVEIPLAMSMAEKVVGLISTIYPQMKNSGISKRILELEEEYGKLDPTVVFKIADEVSDQKFCKFNTILEAMDAGIRIGFAYITLGVVSSPIEGYTGIEVGKTRKGEEYIIANFSGPIRSAGTTASCIVLMLIDFLREKFGYAKYDPTEDEIKRVWTELSDFHDRITNLQYMPFEEEALFLAKNMPIQVSGEPSEKLEVSNYKNLDRVNTNFLRSGFCLIMAEGLAQKAAKGFRLYNIARKNGIKATGFDFLKDYIKLHEKLSSGQKGNLEKGVPVYIKDLVAGRPIFGHPSRSGSFRFRYGRGRVSGFSAASIHPATMAVTDNFIATGTQLKLEKPTKGMVATVCDSIEGPIVKLKNGSVKKLQNFDTAKFLYNNIEEIIYLGDLLFPFSDVANRNAELIKPGYVEEWWYLELKKKKGWVKDYYNVSFEEAVELSKKFKIPFYPKFIFYWTQISEEQFLELIEWLKSSRYEEKLILPYNKIQKQIFEKAKRALELLGVPHEVVIENVIVDKINSKALLFNLGIEISENLNLNQELLKKKFKGKSVLEKINSVCRFEIKDKAGDFIGARMGRPEKAKLRKLTGSPNVLFPVGREGGRLRSVQAACELGRVRSSFPFYYCENCKRTTIYRICENCNKKTKQKYYFPELKEESFSKEIEGYEKQGLPYINQDLDINYYLEKAMKTLGLKKYELPSLIKGVRGTSSENKQTEHLAKGILRAKYNLQVNKDGTIRFDCTELPLVCFKPKEISVGIEKLRELGYTKDIHGKELVDDEQILELKPHDVLLPSSPESPDEKADEVFFNVCNFVDEELERFYKLPKFHNLKSKKDLVGQLGVCMAPHNCAGVICRFIGFSNVLGLMASPYMHAAIRRDCDGDEAAVMLLSDVLLNFSKKFLPSHRGGTQDAPLVLNAKIDAGEVDDQILDFEYVYEYPLELYKKAEQRKHSSEVEINCVKDILKRKEDPFVGVGFTHNTSNFNQGVVCSNYKLLETMQDKVKHQMQLVEKLRSVDTSDTARLIISRHFLRDLKGNLRKFSMQTFRCVSCNEIVRRPPLTGVCPRCGGKLIFTINEGGIKKYLEAAFSLARNYNLSPYLKQNLELVKNYIDSIFGQELEKQESLHEWF